MPTVSANGSIKVAETSIRTINDAAVSNVSARVILNLSPTPRICIEIDSVELPPDFDESAEQFDILLDSGATLSVLADLARFERTKDKLLCKGSFTLANGSVTPFEPGNDLTRVTFGLLNFPAFLGEEYQPPKTIEEFEKGYQRRDFVILEASPWVIELRSLKNTRETIKRLRSDGGYGLTHEGSIRRSDGKPFSTKQIVPLLDLLRLFLSFARGAYCGLTLVAGYNENGHRVWEKWSTSHASPWSGYRSWFDTEHGLMLTELFPGFWNELMKTPRHHPIRLVLHWYLLSNETHSLEGGIVLAQAALERLSQEMVGKKGKKRKEGVWIADALKTAGIPTQIRSRLRNLKRFMARRNFAHGPHTLVEVRNDLVHSDMKRGISSGRIYAQARELGLWYVELMLLKKLGYAGKYGNRLTQEWRGQVELVPWADSNVRQ